MNVTKEELRNANIGDTIEFGEIEWTVIDKGEDTRFGNKYRRLCFL